MPKCKIVIDRDIDKCFEKVDHKFRTDLRIPNSMLNVTRYETKARTVTGAGQNVTVKQYVTISPENYSITIENVTDKTTADTLFQFTKKSDNETLLEYSEYAKGTKSPLRSLNFLLFELPILRSGTVRKMKYKLENIKAMVEGMRL